MGSCLVLYGIVQLAPGALFPSPTTWSDAHDAWIAGFVCYVWPVLRRISFVVFFFVVCFSFFFLLLAVSEGAGNPPNPGKSKKKKKGKKKRGSHPVPSIHPSRLPIASGEVNLDG